MSGVGPGTVLGPRREGLEAVEVDHQLVVWNAVTEELHRLDEIASLIHRCCDGSTSLAETATDLGEAFGRAVPEIWQDVVTCAERLLAAGLVEVVDGPDS